METGFLNKLDNEYFSADCFEQSNGFESENSFFNVLTIDCTDRPSDDNWIIPDEISNTAQIQKKCNEEDFRKTFENWQQHLSSLQSHDDNDDPIIIKEPLLCSPLTLSNDNDNIKNDNIIFEAPISIPIDKIKKETFLNDNNNEFIIKTEGEIKIEKAEEVNDDEEDYIMPDINKELLLQIDKTELNNLNEIDDVKKKFNIKIEKEDCSIKSNWSNEGMPVLSPVERHVGLEVNEDECMFLNPPKLEISANKNKPEIETKLFTTDLGPDNYDVVEIKVETDEEPGEVIEENVSEFLPDTFYDPFEVPNSNMPNLENSVNLSSMPLKNVANNNSVQNLNSNRIKDSSCRKKKISTDTNLPMNKNSQEINYDNNITNNKLKLLQIKPGESLLIKNQYNITTDNSNNSNNKCIIKADNVNIVTNESTTSSNLSDMIIEEPKKKKKLNLEEYRSRRKNIKAKTASPIKANNNNNNKSELDNSKKSSDSCNTTPTIENTNGQTTQLTIKHKKVENRKQNNDTNIDRRYRRRSCSSSSSSDNGIRSRSRSRRRRHRNKWRYYSKGHSPRSRSRSRSRSSSSNRSLSSSSSLTRSRSRTSRYHYRSGRSGYRKSSYSRHSRYSQERIPRRHDDWSPIEKLRQIEERRVIYVGQIEEGTTKSQLRDRFETFGPVIDISLHFRERGDNYGFVTFAYKMDAYNAVEHGNDYPLQPQYDICFGGRRAFCKQRYSDLDGSTQGYSPYLHPTPRPNDSFELLLREAQEKIRKQKHV